MLGVFAATSAVAARSPTAAERADAFFEPACQLFRTWLVPIFAPGLISLPLSMPALRASDLCGFLLLVAIGVASSTTTNAAVASLLAPDDGLAAAAAAAPASAPQPDPFPRAQRICLVAGALLFGTLHLVGGATSAPALTLCLLCTTLGSFSVATSACPPRLQLWLHPFVTCTGVTLLTIGAIGAISGRGARDVLQAYATPWGGAGALLAELMGPAVVSFAFTLYRFRSLLWARLHQLLGTAAIGSLLGMLSAVSAARAIGMDPVLRVALVGRNTLSPLAFEAAKLVGVEPALGMLGAFASGLIGICAGKPLLAWLRVTDPAVRGLALSGAAHGGALLALGDEPAALPFAALMMSLGAACTIALLSLRPVRSLVLTAALGRGASI